MTECGRGLPQVTPFGVSARFVDQHAAPRTTAMAERSYQDALAGREREEQNRQRGS